MKPFLCMAVSFFAVGLVTAVSAVVPADPPLHLQLTVNVRSQPGDQPVGQLGVLVAQAPEPALAKTNASGVAVFSLTVPADQARLVVALSRVGDSEDFSELTQDIARYEEVISSHAFRQYYIVPIPSGQTQLSLDIIGQPAVRVTGRVVDPDGLGVSAFVARDDSPVAESPESQADGTFAFAGVPLGQSTDVFIAKANTSRVRVIRVTSTQTVEDVDLGDVAAPEPVNGTVPVHLTLRGIEVIPWVPSAKSLWVTVVSHDGQFVATYPLNEEGTAQSDLRDSALPLLPDGTYYVVAGPPNGNRAAAGLIRLAREGRAADLDVAGVAKFTAQGTGQVNVDVDAAATEQAIFTLVPEH